MHKWAVVLAAGLCLCGCAGPAASPSNDPYEQTNRRIFTFNQRLDRVALRPTAERYVKYVPEGVRDSIHNALENLDAPAIFTNDLLQGRPKDAGATLGRFVLNSTFGVGGIMDVATPLGIPRHDSDFGQTLAVWGVGEGPYLVLPIIGPSNPRDGVGYLVDSFADPLDQYLQDSDMSWVAEMRFGITVVTVVDANVEVLDDLKRSSMDYYGALRSAYRQRRASQITEATSPGVGWVHVMPHWSWSNLGIQ